MCAIVAAKRKDFRMVKVEDPLLGTTPAEKIEFVENVGVQLEFPLFRPVWLVKVWGADGGRSLTFKFAYF